MAVIAAARTVEVAPISEADAPRVGEFLHANMDDCVPPRRWASAVDVPWSFDRPNAGFMLVADDEIVGAHLAFYSERLIDGRAERFCNLAAWCVLAEYRLYGIRLLKALLGQPGYSFTDLSPSGSVVRINRRLGFRELDASTRIVPHVPSPSWPGRGEIISDHAVIERLLTGRQLEIFRDHVGTQAARHLVLKQDDELCYVIVRRERWKRIPRFASILYVSNPPVFRQLTGSLCRHMLFHNGIIGTLAEERIVQNRLPRLSFRIRPTRPRMFLSNTVDPQDIDYLYSELTCLAW